MKTLLRTVSINALTLFGLSQLPTGVTIVGGFTTYIFAGLVFGIISFIVKPILKILTLPLNIATFGMFSFVINAAILYLLTVIVPQISVNAYIFPGFTLAGFVIPKFDVNTFFAYIIAASIISGISWFIKWIIDW